MANLEELLYQKIKRIMSTWAEADIYAVSFFVYSNEMFCFREYQNVSSFAISYNTESDCEHAGQYAEKRWNYAFWRQDETPIIEPCDNSPEMALLFDWYREQGIENIGEETGDWENGPAGFKELVDLAARIARRLQEEGFLREKFGYPIPILVHDLEYTDCTLEATQYANPNGEAADFLHGNWESEPMDFPPLSSAPAFAADFLKNPEKLQHLLAASPGLPAEDIMDMLKKISGQ